MNYEDVIEIYLEPAKKLIDSGAIKEGLTLFEKGMINTADGLLSDAYGDALAKAGFHEEAMAKFSYAILKQPLKKYRDRSLKKWENAAKEVAKLNPNGSESAIRSKLKEVRVRGLFGQYDHNIKLRPDDEIPVLILSGPNGYGKTSILKILNGFFNRNLQSLFDISFAKIELTFDDGSVVLIVGPKTSDDKALHIGVPEKKLLQKFHRSANVRIDSLKEPRLISRILPRFVRVGEDSWWDSITKKRASMTEIMEENARELELEIREMDQSIEPWLSELMQREKIFFVDTQRLLQPEFASLRTGNSAFLSTDQKYEIVVERDSRRMMTLLSKLEKELETDRAQFYEKLPEQLLAKDAREKNISKANLRKSIEQKFLQLATFQDKAAKRGILINFVKEKYNPYLSLSPDAEIWAYRLANQVAKGEASFCEKLKPVFDKIELLEELINRRFRGKRFWIDKTGGFNIEDEFSDGEIEPRSLASGEQNQLIMFFEMLFEYGDGGLILIDEPELSLHVSWQRSFMEDLVRVLAITGAAAVVATHAPAIVNDLWEINYDLLGEG